MRYLGRALSSAAIIGVITVSLAACSSHAGTALAPSTPTTGHSRVGGSVTAYPISLQSYPISLGAYPTTLGSIPVSAQAYPVCTSPAKGLGTCGLTKRNALKRVPPGQQKKQIAGYWPDHLQGAYGVTAAASSNGSGKTVAVIVSNAAYSPAGVDTTLDSDLSTFRSTMGLPPCTLASGCLQIVPSGAGPATIDPAWSEEAALDVEMVSSICPLCNILIVAAGTPNIPDLGKAVALAATYHPISISNSYAVAEASDNAAYASYYNQPGIAVVAGAGDSGYGANFPATLPNVIAVGGTSLMQNPDGTFQPQTVWAGTGSGCSGFFKKPAFQHDAGCAGRTANDLAVLADPQTGVAGYSSYGNGWNVYGGTSIATPIVAALFALAGDVNSDASGLYARADYTSNMAWISGSNGVCSPSYLCTASGTAASYSGPAGIGVPFGLGAF